MKTIVIFRKWKDGGDIIALMPEVPSDTRGFYCESYQHIGQHSGADYRGCIAASVPAKPREYRDLARELRRLGYTLDIRTRASRLAYQRRLAALA